MSDSDPLGLSIKLSSYRDPLDVCCSHWRAAGIVALCVAASCLFGAFTRPTGFLSALWPANAVLLTLLIRLPLAASPLGIIAAAATYVLIDLSLGSSATHTALLNLGNIVSVLTTFIVWSTFVRNGTLSDSPKATLVLIFSSGAGSSVAGVVGAVADPILFNRGYLTGWSYWFATEFINYMIFLPTLLSVPTKISMNEIKSTVHLKRIALNMLPAVAVPISAAASIMLGGPGALAFPIPALLWVALEYSVFVTSILVMLFSIWLMVSISNGGFLNIDPTDQISLVSLRIGISLIALFPVVLSHVMKAHNELLSKFKHAATHDSLTGALNAGAFRELAQTELDFKGKQISVLMMDMDHFKRINDRYGHAVGDAVLKIFANNVRQNLRSGDIFGRMGGEEFAVVMCCTENQAEVIAERIRNAIKAPIALDIVHDHVFTVSIGLVTTHTEMTPNIDEVLKEADALLYQAKRHGRDRVEKQLEIPQII